MNPIMAANQLQDATDEMDWLARSLKASVQGGASGVGLEDVVYDIMHQAEQMTQLAQELERMIR